MGGPNVNPRILYNAVCHRTPHSGQLPATESVNKAEMKT